MNSDEIRRAYLKFFEERQHKIIPSSSLIPHGDPTLLLTTAGMVQIKPYFLGTSKPPSPRLASCQKCFRTTDVDSVGDTKHLTFFEMLGNFSVGDYFKKEAIQWGWEFVTGHMKLNPDRLWVTVFQNDDEAYNIWKQIGFPENKILRFGEKDNFWGPAGNSGPCGPCSEIHFDYGDKAGCGKPTCDPGCGCGRFLEIWNLVFTQYNQDPNGKRTPLPKPNIDTGMGLERITAAVQDVNTVYETDLFMPIIKKVSEMSGVKYGSGEELDNAIRIVAEHSRGITFLIADGVLPANEGRGYVLRRILRRASFFGRKLGLDQPFLAETTELVIKKMGHVYPELSANHDFIKDLVTTEEKKFDDTLDIGVNLVNKLVQEAITAKRKTIAGTDVFQLYDTYGFLPELTNEIAAKSGLAVDLEGFEKEMDAQRERARSKQKFTSSAPGQGSKLEKAEFNGYENLSLKTRIVQMLNPQSGETVNKAGIGTPLNVILEKSPFYGEMGGQVGDTGELKSGMGRFRVDNTVGGMQSILIGEVTEGEISTGESIEAIVDIERRLDISRNHTATHLLQAALRNLLGTHVSQRGSLVTPEGLRFDFSHLKEISREDLTRVENFVNEKIRSNIPVKAKVIPYKEAIASGAIALFEEKYGDTVRMLQIGEPAVSTELCGGTHLNATGEIGTFLVLSESSIGTGLRRIEAVTGREAEKLVRERLDELNDLGKLFNASVAELPKKAKQLQDEIKAKNKAVESMEKVQIKGWVDDIISNKQVVNGVNVISYRVPPTSLDNLRELGDLLRDKIGSAVIVLGTCSNEKVNFVATVTPELVKKGLNAGLIIKQIATMTGGSGGGRPDSAQAGGKDPEKLDEALKAVAEIVNKAVLK
jgi:alanyl-tRNA synthetase